MPGNGDGNCYLLAHTLRESSGSTITRGIGKRHSVQRHFGAFERGGIAGERQEVFKVLARTETVVKRDVFWQVSHVPASILQACDDVDTANQDLALLQRLKTQNQIQGSGLASAIATEQGIDFTCCNGQIETIQHLLVGPSVLKLAAFKYGWRVRHETAS